MIDARIVLKKYNFYNYGPNNELFLIDCTYKQYTTARTYLRKFFKDNPDKTTLIFYAFSVHGLCLNGL